MADAVPKPGAWAGAGALPDDPEDWEPWDPLDPDDGLYCQVVNCTTACQVVTAAAVPNLPVPGQQLEQNTCWCQTPGAGPPFPQPIAGEVGTGVCTMYTEWVLPIGGGGAGFPAVRSTYMCTGTCPAATPTCKLEVISANVRISGVLGGEIVIDVSWNIECNCG